MKYEKLSLEAKCTLKGMVEFCINNGYCMGIDEGLILNENPEDDYPQRFRAELEEFSGYANNT